MGWFGHVLWEHSYISGAIACVVTFGVLRAARSQPVRIANCMTMCVISVLSAILEVRRFWPPTHAQWALLVGIALTSFLFSFMLARQDPITFDPATRQFIREKTVLGSALRAIFVGVVIAFAPLYLNSLGEGNPLSIIILTWFAGSSLSLWQRTERAQWA